MTKTEKVELAMREAEFRAIAEERYAAIASAGKTIQWPDMLDHLEARISGRAPDCACTGRPDTPETES